MTDATESRPETSERSRRAAPRVLTTIMALMLIGLNAPPAWASSGYEPDSSTPTIDLEGERPSAVAIDQSNQRIYVAMPLRSQANVEFGQIEQLESSGAPTATSPFTLPSEPVFSGVAVNPVTHGIYAAEVLVSTPIGNVGRSRVDQFSATGTVGTQFATNNPLNAAPRIATDPSGNLYYPNASNNTVQVFNSSGVVLETISCGSCPGGSFNNPDGVALDSNENLYVVDLGNGRVLKFEQMGGGSYAFASVLQSGAHAVSVGVDPSNDNVFVGDASNGTDYHVVAYNASGTQFDDFGAGIFLNSTAGAAAVGQIAVNATTHKLYATDPDANALRVFSLVTINPPTSTTNAASSVGQVTAKLNATVNANLHAVVDCHFEYTNDADFQANGYTNATKTPCGSLPSGSANTPVSVTLSSLSTSTTYHYRIVAANNGGSTNGGSQAFTTLPLTSATVTTEAASAVKQTTATLNGKVNPHGGSVSNCHFEYGVGLSYSQTASCGTAIGPVTTDVSLSPKLTGLTANTNYHFRLVVTTNAGLVTGNDSEFTTPAPLPVVTTESATGVTETSATVAGQVNPSGNATTCHFEYGTSLSYGTSAACPTDPGNGSSPVGEQLNLTGLVAGTTYHYRLVGTNAGGTANGVDQTFTTQSPPPTTPPAEQPPVVTPVPVIPVTPPSRLKCKKGFQKKRVHGKLRCVKKKRKRRHH